MDRLASKLTVKENLNPVYTLLYTLPGIPSIYYGSEWGVEGKKEGGNDDPLRPRLDLEEMKKNAPVGGLEAWIRTLGRMKKENPALSYGTYKELALTNRQYAFARMMDDKAVLIAVNNDEQEAEISVPVPVTASFGVDAVLGEQVSLENGVWKVHLAANGSAVLCVG